MTCDGWRDTILLDADGALRPADRERLAAHLSVCPACRRYAADARRILEAFRPDAASAIPPALSRRLTKLALGVTIRRPALRWVRLMPAAAAVVAAAALVIFLAPPQQPARLTEAELLYFGERQIAADLADLTRAIERQARPVPVAWPDSTSEATTRAEAIMPGVAASAVPRFDDELDRIGIQIEVLDRPIFEDPVWTEGGSG